MDQPGDDNLPASRWKDGVKAEDGRPYVKQYAVSKFRVGDQVYIKATASQAQRGPFTVCYVNGTDIQLEKAGGALVDDGKVFGESQLEFTS